jgi:hypothetical protein
MAPAGINGTFLDVRRLAPRMPAKLSSGGEIPIGRNGVKLKFMEGQRPSEKLPSPSYTFSSD